MKKSLIAISIAAAFSSQALAFEFDTGDDWEIRWDNTFKGNLMARVQKQDKDIYQANSRNAAYWLTDDSTL